MIDKRKTFILGEKISDHISFIQSKLEDEATDNDMCFAIATDR